MGITQATYDRWRWFQGFPTRPVREIFRKEVAAIALALFDFSVNSGLGRAREALAAVGEDWRRVVAYRLQFLASLEIFQAFKRDWTRRVAALVEECAALDPPSPRPSASRSWGGTQSPGP